MRRRVRRETMGVALFPFLAVLICTMGALIVLLVMMVQQASVEAKAIAARQARAPGDSPEALKKQQEALSDANWRREMLEQQRTQRQEELQNRRLELSHLEDHIRRLNEKGKELMALLEEVEAGKKTTDEELAASRSELDQVQREIAGKQDELAKKKKQLGERERWYALIPYDGPNGTRRMPIYVECVEEGIFIQPEGVQLTTQDFRGELGPGNPLDAALRVKREYIMKVTRGRAGEPYPLLVVRPSGVMAYSAARAAMKSWDDEFGYELIAEDKKLDFGPRDPLLDQIMQSEITQARRRQAVLVAAMPRKYQREELVRSFAPEDSPEVQRRRDTLAGSGGNGGTGRGIGGNDRATGTGSTGSGTSGAGMSGPGTGRTGSLAGGPANPAGQSGATGNLAPVIGPYGMPGNRLESGVAASVTDGHGSGGMGPGGTGPGGSLPGGARPSGLVPDGSAGSTSSSLAGQARPAGGSPSLSGGAPGGSAASGSASGQAGSPPGSNVGGGAPGGGSTAASGASGSASGSASGGSAGGMGSSAPPPGAQGAPNLSLDMSPPSSQPSAETKTAKRAGGTRSANIARGTNWGLPAGQRYVTGVTRPIRVAMQRDKLILLPERAGERRPEEIPLSPEMTPQQLETLVAGVQRQMRSWGIAVDGGYWKPALSVDVQPGAEDRFAELKSALFGSGIEVQRKTR